MGIIQLQQAEQKAADLFAEVGRRGLIIAGKSEKKLNTEVFNLAFEMFGIRKYWHKRIVRSGPHTLYPYRENPPDRIIESDDVVFFDFGPVFDEWEADYGRTYVVGANELKKKLICDVEQAWMEGKLYYEKNRNSLTGAEFYAYTRSLALKYGWEYGNEHCGHLVGNFPHEELQGEEKVNYLHPENDTLLCAPDRNENPRYWIYEIHFIDRDLQIGGFFEQLLSGGEE